jgi:hypothetical protein
VSRLANMLTKVDLMVRIACATAAMLQPKAEAQRAREVQAASHRLIVWIAEGYKNETRLGAPPHCATGSMVLPSI